MTCINVRDGKHLQTQGEDKHKLRNLKQKKLRRKYQKLRNGEQESTLRWSVR